MFRERYGHEIPLFFRLMGVTRILTDSIEFNWGYFAPKFGFEMMLNRGTYFDQHYAIDICLLFGKLRFNLPFKTKIPEGCDTPRYGIEIHNDTLWLHLGGKMDEGWNQCNSKWITWDIPIFTWIFDSHLVWDGKKWIKPVSGEYDPPYSDGRLTEKHPYTYELNSGEIQNRTATCFIEKRQWHRKWFPFSKMIKKSLDISFDGEVGEETGSWKGGTTGCGYDIKEGELILECLRRMEKERKF